MIHSRKFILACSCLLLPVGIMAESSAWAAAPATPAPAPAAAATPAPAASPEAAPLPDGTPGPLDPNAPSPIAPPAPGTITGQAPAAPIDTGAAAANPGAARAREFQGDEVGQVLRLLARQAKISLVVSSQVAGTVNMRLEDVTAMQAIQVICQSQNYDLSQANGVYYVKTSAEKAAEPTEGAFYTFSYAKASVVVPLLTSQMKSKLIPPQFDERTNTVFYQEAKSNLATIRELLERVDRPTRQVMIEARLVEVTANPQQSYGINWGGVVGSSTSPKTFVYGGSGFASESLVTSTNPVTGQVTTSVQQSTLAQGTTNTAGGLNAFDFLRNGNTGSGFLGNLGGQFAILDIPSMSATMRFLNEDQDTEFLANPRVVTADNQKATIKIVRDQPVPELNFNSQTATAVFSGFKDKPYGNTLVVTPSINKDNFITLSVQPEISNRVGDAVFNFAGATVSSPIVDTRTLDSNVLIKSGCTLAIGGLLQDETTRGTTKVPILGDIPIVGYFFQEHLNSRTKRNLLIFVTPTIISQQFGTGLEDQITGLKNSSLHNEYADPRGWRNNANGNIRLIKSSEKQIAADYPAPGDCNPNVSFKETATPKGD